MKISKSLFLAFAGLGLFACSNEDVTEGGVQGNSSVTVKVNLPQLLTESRSGDGIVAGAETEGTTGSQTPVVIGEKGVTVTLYSASGTSSPQTVQMSGSDIQTGIATFQNVRTPQRVEVSVNGGTVTDLSIDQINEAGLAAPLYATSSDFQAGEDGKSYTISVTPQPRYARLELSGITHDTDHGTGSCIFKKAKLAGLFLDNVWVTEKSADGIVNVANNAGIWDNIKKADYASPTWSAIDADFLASATWPVEGNCYAYSLFGETQLPSVVFVLDGTTLQFNDGVQMAGYTSGADLYARVSTFKINKPADWDQKKEEYKTKYGVDDNGQFISFKAGNIYQISDIAIPDKAWGTTPGGGTDVSVTATVNVLPWTVVEGTVEW